MNNQIPYYFGGAVKIVFLSILALIFLLLVAMTQQPTNRKSLNAQQAFDRIQNDTNIVVLDVRTPDEFDSETGHLKNAILIPVQELESRLKELGQYKDKTIIAVCRSGNRSARATALLNQKGFTAFNLEGGMLKDCPS